MRKLLLVVIGLLTFNAISQVENPPVPTIPPPPPLFAVEVDYDGDGIIWVDLDLLGPYFVLPFHEIRPEQIEIDPNDAITIIWVDLDLLGPYFVKWQYEILNSIDLSGYDVVFNNYQTNEPISGMVSRNNQRVSYLCLQWFGARG